MATKTKKKKSAKQDAALVAPHRKLEALGLILLTAALLLALAIVTYDSTDNTDLDKASTLGDLFTPGEIDANNALGSVGAALARVLVPNFLGYVTLVFAGLLLGWGWTLFRRRRPIYLPLLTGSLTAGAFVLAALIGWLGVVTGWDVTAWGGAVGGGLAVFLTHALGVVGGFLVLLMLLGIIALLIVDLDVQRSLDRLEEGAAGMAARTQDWYAQQKVASQERREERARLRVERREARAAELEATQSETTSSKKAAEEPAPKAETPTRPTLTVERPSARKQQAEPQEEAPPKPVKLPPQGDYPRVNDLFRDPGEELEPVPIGPPEREAAPAASTPPAPAQPPPVQPPPSEPTEDDVPERDAEGPALHVQERKEERRVEEVRQKTEDAPAEDVPFHPPTIDLLDHNEGGEAEVDFDELEENKNILLDKLATYKIEITDINAIVGPTVTLYELVPAPGVKISRITAREDDLAMAMAASGIRLIAPIPGKSAVGVEIPNRHREMVRLRDVLATERFAENDMALPCVLGKNIEGEVFVRDLAKMPHLLIAGATGSGKSVGLNAVILGLLYACHPANLKFVLIDPKKIELAQYGGLAEHYLASFPGTDDSIITDVQESLGVLQSCVREMERRYDLLSKASVRGIKEYNKKLRDGKISEEDGHEHLPYIVVIVDELADLMMTAGKEIEAPIARLAQMARAIGIHLILATQRPSVDVITGLIKANFPARMAYQVASRIDSRTILDGSGAEGLVGNGDLLYMLGSHLVRLQGPFVSIDEVDRIVEFIADQDGPGPYELPSVEPEDSGEIDLDAIDGATDRDDLFKEAAYVIVRAQQGSVSLLQRKLSIGYTRAARIVDQLEDAGIVGGFEGSKARDVLVADEAQLDKALTEDREDRAS